MAFSARTAQYHHDGTGLVTSGCSSWNDGKALVVTDSVLLDGKEPYRYNDYLLSDCIEHATIIVEPEVILCLTFVILAASQLLNPSVLHNPWAW
jgi:hypothetical protein